MSAAGGQDVVGADDGLHARDERGVVRGRHRRRVATGRAVVLMRLVYQPTAIRRRGTSVPGDPASFAARNRPIARKIANGMVLIEPARRPTPVGLATWNQWISAMIAQYAVIAQWKNRLCS